jgi:hypothetical protein
MIICNSCGVNREKIIGQKIDFNSLPYGKYGNFDEIFLNGVRQKVFVVYYKNKALVYIYDNNRYIVDYYFSNIISYENVKNKFLIGSEYSSIIKKLGVPFAICKYSEYFPDTFTEPDRIFVLYYQKMLWEGKKEYDVLSFRVFFKFDLDGKLEDILELRSWFP